MFSRLLLTELEANKYFILAFVVGNLLFFLAYSLGDVEIKSTGDFALTTMIFFLVSIMASLSSGSEQKRLRLYAQLPITPGQVTIATWTIIIGWLGLQLLFWLSYGFLVDPDFSADQIPGLAAGAVGFLFFMVAIAIGVDLGDLKRRRFQLIYIAGWVVLIALQASLVSGLESDEEKFYLPFLVIRFYDEVGVSTLIVTGLCMAMLYIDYLIYKNSDSYLR